MPTTRDYTPRVFTKEEPCSKIDIHNCFYHGSQYTNVPVIEARTIIGLNAPKYLIRENFLVERQIRGVDHYCLTAAGDHWLRLGIIRYLTLHPDKVNLCRELPPGFTREKTSIKLRRGAVEDASTRLAGSALKRLVIRRHRAI